MKNVIKATEYFYSINGVELKEVIQQEELSDYQIRDVKEFTYSLIQWIGEAVRDREVMIEDLKYLMNLEDEFMFSSIQTNEYICFSDNEERFDELCAEFLALSV